ncbi:MAG: glutamate-5-semialdehyde dehydrogenase [Clostridia bacterium]|nr:glutamate-5-semialdehyde dehydrogenase [Clostridia bacterium]
MTVLEMLSDAKASAKKLSLLSTEEKNNAIIKMAEKLVCHTDLILAANEIDVNNAKGKISDVMIDRLRLDKARIEDMAKGMKDVAALPDPVGNVLEEIKHKNGMTIKKISVPIGVVAIIYESRPNVTSDAAALTFKSGNVSVLRTGKEAYNSAKAIVDALHEALEELSMPKGFINLIKDTSHEGANTLMTANGLVDLLIPRGSARLIKACVENATVPCIETGTGICHVYVDEFADIDKALNIIENAKTSRPSVCNAEEVLLVNEKIANTFLPLLKERLYNKRIENGLSPVIFKLCEKSIKIIDGTAASPTDFDTEFLDYILAVKIVKDVNEAIEHIQKHSTGHSDAIVTENNDNADLFIKSIDSAAVYVNVSTRFTDGGEFGLGCEMGISTQKLHARGPMGLKEMTTYKYVITGNGQTR